MSDINFEEWSEGKKGRRGLVFGVGINDATNKTQQKIGGKNYRCPYYVTWCDMLKRCYSEKFQKTRPTYIGCSVCDEWLTFSSFRNWMRKQKWKGMQLDKDLISKGNKVYCPELCAFVTPSLNKFLDSNSGKRGKYLPGTSWCNYSGKYKASCSNPFTKKLENLGRFSTEIEAHKAWLKRKHEIALSYAEMADDKRVSDALYNRYKGG